MKRSVLLSTLLIIVGVTAPARAACVGEFVAGSGSFGDSSLQISALHSHVAPITQGVIVHRGSAESTPRVYQVIGTEAEAAPNSLPGPNRPAEAWSWGRDVLPSAEPYILVRILDAGPGAQSSLDRAGAMRLGQLPSDPASFADEIELLSVANGDFTIGLVEA